MDYKYYDITIDAGTCHTGRTIRTVKGIKAIEKHVKHDNVGKNWTAKLVKCVEVTEEKYLQFINLFVENDWEKVIAGTTI